VHLTENSGAAPLWKKCKKTRMKPKTSHQNNENFAFTTQFPDVWITVGKSQNFHGKL
jgi:hypothetical protein